MTMILTACRRRLAVATLALCVIGATAARATELQISNYNDGMSGQIWAIALEKGYLKELGIDGIRTSVGGTSDIRALIAGDMAYIETGVAAIVTAIRQGEKLKIISDVAMNFGSTAWFTVTNSPVNSLADLKGKRVSYSTPKSGLQILDMMMMKKYGYTDKDVTLVPAGGISPSLAMLEVGGIDVIIGGIQIYYAQPPGKYKMLAMVNDVLPPMTNVVGVTSEKSAREQGDLIRKLIVVRRKALDFLNANPDEGAVIMAKPAKWDIEVTKKVTHALVGHDFWSPGSFGKDDMDNAIAGLKLVGIIEDDRFSWRDMVDEQFLPDDLKTIARK